MRPRFTRTRAQFIESEMWECQTKRKRETENYGYLDQPIGYSQHTIHIKTRCSWLPHKL